MNYNFVTHNEYLNIFLGVRARVPSVFAKINKARKSFRTPSRIGAEFTIFMNTAGRQNMDRNRWAELAILRAEFIQA